jgi:hypothetical protein
MPDSLFKSSKDSLPQSLVSIRHTPALCRPLEGEKSRRVEKMFIDKLQSLARVNF